mmetsp:Transcript_51711/g.159369  ORF Transcript_51711/g.159369 Transcript_51711/m.159369 type:complete len:204 (+) Transcript_51711:419-1030(+)
MPPPPAPDAPRSQRRRRACECAPTTPFDRPIGGQRRVRRQIPQGESSTGGRRRGRGHPERSARQPSFVSVKRSAPPPRPNVSTGLRTSPTPARSALSRVALSAQARTRRPSCHGMPTGRAPRVASRLSATTTAHRWVRSSRTSPSAAAGGPLVPNGTGRRSAPPLRCTGTRRKRERPCQRNLLHRVPVVLAMRHLGADMPRCQ